MTRLRIGWGVGPKPLVGALTGLQGASTSNASSPMQHGDQRSVEEMVRAFDVRRRFVVGRLNALLAASMETLTKGLNRLKNALEEIA